MQLFKVLCAARTAGRRRTALLIAALAAFLMTAGPASAAELAAVRLGSFVEPSYVTAAPGHPRLLFVVERGGRIRLMADEVKQATPFLDISSLVRGPPDAGAGPEQGLLSIAFPPDYPETLRFYVFFTNSTGDLEIDEFRRFATRARVADPNSRRVVLTIPHRQAKNHNGGQLEFGPSNLLYISTGDGGGTLPRGEAARRLDSLLGKILRIDPRETETAPYSVPPGNPFVGRAGRNAIFSYGLRNPWRFSIDGANIAIADVGYRRREEVNLLPLSAARGANFGWPQYEGSLVYAADRPGPGTPVFPIFEYDRTETGCAVIGGYVVRDAKLPDFSGRYLYGDYCTGELRSFVPDVAGQTASADTAAGPVIPRLTSFGRGLDGTIYVSEAGATGGVYRLVQAP